METVLITGGCGYIGSHTCISLIKKNYNVLIIDSLINSYEDNFKKVRQIIDKKDINSKDKLRFIKGDLRNKDWLDNIFLEYLKSKKPISSVIHFAGLKSIESSIKDPLQYWDTNIAITLSLLSIMQKYNCFKIIFSSSASVYKIKGSSFLKESDLLEPTNPYGKTKFTIENILEDLFESDSKNEWKIANLRYFNPAGAHESGLLGENPKFQSLNLFPSIIRSINGFQKKLLIFGKDWPTRDGTCIRDFIHVMDLAEAHIATLDFLNNSKPQILKLNIGTGKGTSVLEVINTFQRINHVTLFYEYVERRLGDQPIVVADNTMALKLLNWRPKRNLIDMCRDYFSSSKKI